MRLVLASLLLTLSVSAFAKEAATKNDKTAADKTEVSTAASEATAVSDTALPSLGRESDAKAEKAEKVIQAESEIPLNLEANKKSGGNESPYLRIILSFGILGAVALGAFIFLKKYAKPQSSKNQTQIKVLQQHYLGPKKSLAIIRVAGESLLIGVTDHNISMIKSLSLLDEEVPEQTPQHFSNLVSRFSKNDEIEDEETASAQTEKEDFSFGGIKDIVSKRLKGMRNLE